MKSIPIECQPFVLMTLIMAVLFIAALIRVWLLRRTESKLLKNRDALELQILDQQKDLMNTRQDANAWRAEMQRQFDLFRHMASDQLKVEEKRFDDLLQKSREREHQLQTTLDITKQMCVELPGTKARLMQLESIIGLDDGNHLSAVATPSASTPSFDMAPMPDLDEVASTPQTISPAESTEPAKAKSANTHAMTDAIQIEISQIQQQNTQLKQALAAARLRSRVRERQTKRGQNGKR
ncbi:MAG: hypothetical protein NTV80_04860 [Verrucomicrobia bacterium]|nr:hypothetical protein [Verrucomicrobiota bacterium]